MDYGIKVMKAGHGISDSDIRNIILSSKYNMYKYHLDTTTSLSIPNGSNSGSVSVNHNLGYVPAYIVYIKSSELGGNNFILPYPGGIYSATDYAIKIDSYATNSDVVIRVEATDDFGTYDEYATDYWADYWGANSFISVGNYDGNDHHGAMRFTGVNVENSQSLSSASIHYYVKYKGSDGTWWVHSVGIDEDNTADFSSNPMGRSETSADLLSSHTLPPTGGYTEIYQDSIVSEIISRPGWASGNAIGIKLYNDGSDYNVYAEDDSFQSRLRIVKSGSAVFYFRVIIFKDRIDF